MVTVLGESITNTDFLEAVEALGYTHILHKWRIPYMLKGGDLSPVLESGQLFLSDKHRILAIDCIGYIVRPNSLPEGRRLIQDSLSINLRPIPVRSSRVAEFSIPSRALASIYFFAATSTSKPVAISFVGARSEWQIDFLANNTLKTKSTRDRAIKILAEITGTYLPSALTSDSPHLDSIDHIVEAICGRARKAGLSDVRVQISVSVPEFDDAAYRTTLTNSLIHVAQSEQDKYNYQLEQIFERIEEDRRADKQLVAVIHDLHRGIRAILNAGFTLNPGNMSQLTFIGLQNLELEGVYSNGEFCTYTHRIVVPHVIVELESVGWDGVIKSLVTVKLPYVKVYDIADRMISQTRHPNVNSSGVLCLGSLNQNDPEEVMLHLRRTIAAPNMASCHIESLLSYIGEPTTRVSGWVTDNLDGESTWNVVQ